MVGLWGSKADHLSYEGYILQLCSKNNYHVTPHSPTKFEVEVQVPIKLKLMADGWHNLKSIAHQAEVEFESHELNLKFKAHSEDKCQPRKNVGTSHSVIKPDWTWTLHVKRLKQCRRLSSYKHCSVILTSKFWQI